MTDTARNRAEAFLQFCDGLEQAGMWEYARRGRMVARDVLELADDLDFERSCRRSIQERHEMLLERLELLHGAKALGEVWS